MKYTHSRTEVEAIKVTQENFREILAMLRAGDSVTVGFSPISGRVYAAVLLGAGGGALLVQNQHYLIRNGKGELYPCTPDTFLESYTKSENPA